MASRLRLIFGFALVGCGCTMDNPAFGRQVADGDSEGNVDATSQADAESSDSAMSSTTNGDGDGDTTNGDGDGDTTNGDGDGDGDADTNTTDSGCPLGSACAPCHVCDESGECVPDVGAPCPGEFLHCGDYLYGSEEGACYRLADNVLESQCAPDGECKTPGPSACPPEQGEHHFQCDPGCVTSPEACELHTLAANVGLEAMCAVQGPGPDCQPTCINEMSSNIFNYGCNVGICQYLGIGENCDPYACNEQGVYCYEQCNTEEQCAMQYGCSGGMCGG